MKSDLRVRDVDPAGNVPSLGVLNDFSHNHGFVLNRTCFGEFNSLHEVFSLGLLL